MKYRKKPVEVEAIQWDGDPLTVRPFGPEVWHNSWIDFSQDGNPELCIDTLEGTIAAFVGDYIVRGVQGEFYPVKPDIFEATYELVEGENA